MTTRRAGPWKQASTSTRTAEAWNRLGAYFERHGETDKAEAAYLRAVKADADFLHPLRPPGGLALSASAWRQAFDESANAIAMNPVEYPIAYVDYALAALNLNRWDIAAEAIAGDTDHRRDRAAAVKRRIQELEAKTPR